MNQISRDEIALYDRQIRLWGVDAQKRIREGSVLIRAYSIDGTVQEICKNLTLSGLSRIEISLKTSELSSNILYNDIANQMVEINSKINFKIEIEENISTLKCHDFIVLCGKLSVSEVENINNSARSYGIPSTWCCFHDNLFYVLNDFINFTVGSNEKVEPFTFTSFSDVLRNIDSVKSSKNRLISQYSSVLENLDQQKLGIQTPYEIAGAAIIAAVVCQEVLKFYSRKDAPIQNLFVLDPMNLKNSIGLI